MYIGLKCVYFFSSSNDSSLSVCYDSSNIYNLTIVIMFVSKLLCSLPCEVASQRMFQLYVYIYIFHFIHQSHHPTQHSEVITSEHQSPAGSLAKAFCG